MVRRVASLFAALILGVLLACLMGKSLAEILPEFLLSFFIPFSSLLVGFAAFATARGFFTDLTHGQPPSFLRPVLVCLAAALCILIVCEVFFVKRSIKVGKRQVEMPMIVSWSRNFPELSDEDCVSRYSTSELDACWNHRWAVKLALTFSYLGTLGGLGALLGLLMTARGLRQGPAGYLDFDLWFYQAADSSFRVKVFTGAGYRADESFDPPASVRAFLTERESDRSEADGPSRSSSLGEVPESRDPKEIGSELFQSVFHDEVLKSFQGCLDTAETQQGVRIRLCFNNLPALALLRWEYLYEAESKGFLALSGRTSIVRYLEVNERSGPLEVKPPLRVLVVISDPDDRPKLAASKEWENLCAALKPLRKRRLFRSRLIEIERLENPTCERLKERLATRKSDSPYHVLHFIGHGGFSEADGVSGEGGLLLEDKHGQSFIVSGQSLGYILKEHPSLRLAVLNACDSGRASEKDSFAGTAQSLAQHGVPAVVAMQRRVQDETACHFAEAFYRALAAGAALDACLSDARTLLYAKKNPQWGAPVLYLRATDGQLFAIED